MATYGKKKRTLLSGFSVLKDDQPNHAPAIRSAGWCNIASSLSPIDCPLGKAHTRLGRAKSATQKSENLPRQDNDSADELAGDPLLNHSAQQSMSLSIRSDTQESDYSKAMSHKAREEDRNKPLPPIPITAADVIKNSKEIRPALTSKSTNIKIIRKSEKTVTRPTISHPILHDSEDNSHNAPLRAVNGTSLKRTTTGIQTSVGNADGFSRKMTGRIEPGSARQAAKSFEVGDNLIAAYAKASPLQRSKAALIKATQVIATRLTTVSQRVSTSNPGSRSNPVGFEYKSDSKTSPETLHHGSSTSNSDILRDHLPVYESMRTVRHSPDPLQDPFSDGDQANDQISPEIPADLEFDFSKRRRKGRVTSAGNDLIQDTSANDAASQAARKYSRMISGLAQHPNTTVFSTPPIGFSTPRDRLMLSAEQPQDSPLPGGTAHTPSILEFSFEESDDDDMSETQTSEAINRNLSIKRKSAKDNLRSQLSPLSKRFKKSSITSKNHMDFPMKTKHMDTKDSGPLLGMDTRVGKSRPATANSGRKGFGVFEKAVRQDPSDSLGDKLKRPGLRNATAKRLSSPTPNSILFSRESRAHYRLRDTSDGDTLDVDELQAGESGYNVRVISND